MPGRKPQLLAFVLCQETTQEPETGKWTLTGTFNAVRVSKLPCMFTPFCIYICLSDFAGGATVTTVVRDPEDGVVYAVRAKVSSFPLGVAELALPYPPVELKKAGSHSIELLVDEELIAVRSLIVELQSPPS